VRHSTNFYPQCDGLSKRAIQTISQKLRCQLLDGGNQGNIFCSLQKVTLRNNDLISKAHGKTPREVMEYEGVRNFEGRIDEAKIEEVRTALAVYTDRMKSCFDLAKGKRTKKLMVGDWVLVSNKRLMRNGPGLLDRKYSGPFKIRRKFGGLSYRIGNGKTSPRFG
jgi:hypothetical protein